MKAVASCGSADFFKEDARQLAVPVSLELADARALVYRLCLRHIDVELVR